MTSNITECAAFVVRKGFDSYMSDLLDNGLVNVSLVQTCKAQICIAIWGEGNADISGVGMMVGYVLDHVLGLIMASLVLITYAKKKPEWQKMAVDLLGSFHDCAAFLCFPIQTAAIVMLIREEAGISTEGMGDGSVRITEAVSLLTLLPLVYAVVLSGLGDAENEVESHHALQAEREHPDTRNTSDTRSAKRFGVLVLCWLMAFFPFYCKMNNVFGPSSISNTPGSAITVEQFSIIENICFEGMKSVSSAEDKLMSALSILTYIPISVTVVGRIILLALRKHHRDSKTYVRLRAFCRQWPAFPPQYLLVALLAAVPLLGAGLIWTVIRVRKSQMQLSYILGAGDGDSQWTFGQIVASTAFAPVLVDCVVLAKDKLSNNTSEVSAMEDSILSFDTRHSKVVTFERK